LIKLINVFNNGQLDTVSFSVVSEMQTSQ